MPPSALPAPKGTSFLGRHRHILQGLVVTALMGVVATVAIWMTIRGWQGEYVSAFSRVGGSNTVWYVAASLASAGALLLALAALVTLGLDVRDHLRRSGESDVGTTTEARIGMSTALDNGQRSPRKLLAAGLRTAASQSGSCGNILA